MNPQCAQYKRTGLVPVVTYGLPERKAQTIPAFERRVPGARSAS